MKYGLMSKIYGKVCGSIAKCEIEDKKIRKDVKKEYREIILRASDIGENNTLFASYALAAYFIAMNRKDGLTAEENCAILDKGMRKSKLLKAFLGDSKSYFCEKHMEMRRKWSKQTHERKYKNDWVVDVIEKTPDFEFGFDYTECGVVKLCRDEGCPELAKYLCHLDFMLVELIGIKLNRTGTLAEGADKCDFRFVGK